MTPRWARALALLALAWLLADHGCCPYRPDCLGDDCLDPADDDAGGDDDATAAVHHSLEVVAQRSLPEMEGFRRGLVGAVNEYSYLLDGPGQVVRYLTDAYVHPDGDFCLGAPPGDTDCEQGTLWTSGRIEATSPVATLCQDRERGQLFLIKEGPSNAKVEVVDVHPGGDKAYSYNRPVDVVQLPEELTADGWYVGPCTYVPGTGALVLSAPDLGRVARLDIGTAAWESSPLGTPSKITLLGDGETLLLDRPSEDAFVLVDASDLGEIMSIPAGGKIVAYDVDLRRNRVWITHGPAGGASMLALDEDDPVARPVDVGGDVQHVAADPTTGTAVYGVERETGWRLYLADGDRIVDTLELEEPLLGLVSPSDAGDVLALTEVAEGGVRVTVLDAVPDGPDRRPPLHAFLFAAIEKPADSELEEPCTGEGVSFETRLSIIEANAEVLASLDVPVVLGFTYNFALTAQRCDREDIFETLQGHGFELGSMVHNKPCYHCTDNPQGDVPPDQCAAGTPLHCDPASGDCCFPGHEEYCALGDWDCYKAFIDEHNLLVDGMIDGGGAFVVGADRHGLWDWDWARGYKEMARADGSEGYDTAFFAQAWAYPDQLSYNDPRNKEPAPWSPSDRVEAWYLGDYDQWDQDSAFSELQYLPGLPVSVVKLHEWHATGLFLVDFFNVAAGIQYTEDDFADLTQYLRRSVNLRTGYAPNVWYFHIHELGETNLADATGAELEGTPLLRDWIEMVEEDFVEPGHVVWQFPSEIREAYPP